jgi:hypothetical protein
LAGTETMTFPDTIFFIQSMTLAPTDAVANSQPVTILPGTMSASGPMLSNCSLGFIFQRFL